MFSLLTVLLAFAVGGACGATAVWFVTENYKPAFITLGGSLLPIVILVLRFISEW